MPLMDSQHAGLALALAGLEDDSALTRGDLDGEFLDRVMIFQNGLIARATGNHFDGGNAAYRRFRSDLMSRSEIRHLLPAFLRQCSDLGQFWAWISYEKRTYAERRNLIWDALRPLIAHLESGTRIPSDDSVSGNLAFLDSTRVREMWQSGAAPLSRTVSCWG